MRPATRDLLLWLAGVGGALVIFRETLGLLRPLAATVSPVLLGFLLVLSVAAGLGLALVRRRLADGPPLPDFAPRQP